MRRSRLPELTYLFQNSNPVNLRGDIMDNAMDNTILIVDDTPSNLAVLAQQLKRAGFKVLVAENGQRAIYQAEQAQPDIILLDIRMPDMDGFETCRRLKANAITQEIPVIFVTALGDIESKVTGFEVGAVDYVTKPLEPREVLARVTTQIKLRQLQHNLQERNQELDTFARTVAHDLKSPLNTIVVYASILEEVLEKMQASNDDRLLATAIARGGKKMAEIIDALLLLSRMRQEDIELVSLDMPHLITEVQASLAHLIAEHNATITIIDPTTWPEVVGYAPWVEEVWANYISNAVKYGGQPPHVEVGATLEDHTMARFWVKDNGQGLTPEQQSKLFVPFTRLDEVQIKATHGLGLSIVASIIEKQGGNVGVESTPGEGSIFSFTLPLKAYPSGDTGSLPYG